MSSATSTSPTTTVRTRSKCCGGAVCKKTFLKISMANASGISRLSLAGGMALLRASPRPSNEPRWRMAFGHPASENRRESVSPRTQDRNPDKRGIWITGGFCSCQGGYRVWAARAAGGLLGLRLLFTGLVHAVDLESAPRLPGCAGSKCSRWGGSPGKRAVGVVLGPSIHPSL